MVLILLLTHNGNSYMYVNPAAMFPAYVTGLSCAAAGGCSTQNHAPADPGHH